MAPTRIRVQPVAHEGMEAKMGAKKILRRVSGDDWEREGSECYLMKKQTPVVIAVIPVFPPSEIPAPDSMKAVTGGEPKREPIEIPKASTM
jgi:hypothetical protein